MSLAVFLCYFDVAVVVDVVWLFAGCLKKSVLDLIRLYRQFLLRHSGTEEGACYSW